MHSYVLKTFFQGDHLEKIFFHLLLDANNRAGEFI